MVDILYIMHCVDEWEGYKYIYGAYSSREKAIDTLLEDYDDLIYDEQRKQWEHPDPEATQFFYIEEIPVN